MTTLILLTQVLIVFLAFNQSLAVSRYNVESAKISGQIKLALVTDLHACEYGDGQSELLRTIDREAPDVILLCGDVFDDRTSSENAVQLVRGIADKYVCYYVSGNHDTQDEYKIIVETYGVKVLEGTSEILEVHGDKIRIAGIDDPDVERYANAGRITTHSLPYTEQIKQLSTTIDSGVFTILLSHRPERIEELLPLKPNLILSGHAHGGQIRIPVILRNGLWSPNQGFFPRYTNGVYSFGETELIVSRGLSQESDAVPRIFNRPEIVVIILK